jgi:hypothetical protein
MKIPGAERAVVDIRKLRDYCLSTTHPRDQHKALVFASVLGLTEQEADFLRDRLLQVVANEEATLTGQDSYGERYLLDFELQGPTGKATIRSSWIVRTDEDFPRLITCYVL